MSSLVPGIVVLIGKIVFLGALYGFLYIVFRGLMTQTRYGRRRSRAGGNAAASAVTEWELGPPAAAPVLHPPSPTAAAPEPASAPAEPRAEQPPAPEAPAEPPAKQAPSPIRLTPPPEPAQTHATLVVLTSPEASLGSAEKLRIEDRATVGRSDDNDIVLRDRFVSGHHAEIIRRSDGYVLRDLDSTNGTFCNGTRVDGEVALGEGDRLGIGTTVFAFHRRSA